MEASAALFPNPTFNAILIALGLLVAYGFIMQPVGRWLTRREKIRATRNIPSYLACKTVNELIDESRRLDDEANEFIGSVRGRPMRSWSFGEYAAYLSIRRREEELDTALALKSAP